MGKSKTPPPDSALVPDVSVEEGGIASPEVNDGLPNFPVHLHPLLKADSGDDDSRVRFEVKTQKMALFDVKQTQIKPLPLWRRQLPQVAAPQLPSRRIEVRSFPVPLLETRVRRGRFKPVQVRMHMLEPFAPPAVGDQLVAAKACFWRFPVFRLQVFRPEIQAHVRWYSRERLGFDLATSAFLGICCPLPPYKLQNARIEKTASGQLFLLARVPENPNDAPRNPYGLIFEDNSGLSITRIPSPNQEG